MHAPGAAGGKKEEVPKPGAAPKADPSKVASKPEVPPTKAPVVTDPAKPEEPPADTTTKFVPYYFHSHEKLDKTNRVCVQKSWRDWSAILQNMRNFGVMDGYEVPKSLSKGRFGGAGGTTLLRVAVDESDIDILSGREPMNCLARAIRRAIACNWFQLASGVPAYYYIPRAIYTLLDAVITKVVHKLARAYIRLNAKKFADNVNMTIPAFLAAWFKGPGVNPSIITPARINLLIKLVVSLCVWAAGRWVNRFFSCPQTYLVVKIGSQAVEQTVREIGNAEQEKATITGIASLPAMTRVANESLDCAKAMQPMDKVQYSLVSKFIVAASAQNVVQKHVPSTTSQVVAHIVSNINSKIAKQAKEKDDREKIAKEAENKKIADAGAAAEKAELKNLEVGKYRLLATRNATAYLKKPSIMRDSVEIQVKTKEKIFEDKQRGLKIATDGDEKLINYAGVIFAPDVLRVITSLSSSIENELSGANRHLKKLINPVTKEIMKKPSLATEERLDRAAEIMAKHLRRSAQKDLGSIAYWDAPKKWTAQMREEMPELAEQGTQNDGVLAKFLQRVMTGFAKQSEFMVDEEKDARLIGNQGTKANMEDAMSYAPLEHLMLDHYEHLITKGKTLDEIDNAMSDVLLNMRKKGLQIASDDFSAMDSSWTYEDRQRLHKIACAVLEPLQEYLKAKLRAMDPVLEAGNAGKQIKWHLKYITLLMDPIDSPLFSGERPTSLKNRWLVLLQRFAEELRVAASDAEGERAIIAILDGEEDITKGDGDDDAQGIPPGRYRDEEHRISCYADMYKILVPASNFYEMTDCEVLSRFHIWCPRTEKYIHIAKLQRQMGRLIAYKIPRTNIDCDITTTELTQTELITICTDVWQRSVSLRSTMVVRHFARAIFDFAFKQIKNGQATTIYNDDAKRLGREDGDQSLWDCFEDINEGIASARCSGRSMVKVAHFKTFHDMMEEDIADEAEEWEKADESWSTAEIDWGHLLYPESFLNDFPISCRVAVALGIQESCMVGLRLREYRETLFDYYECDGEVTPPNTREEGSLGELADVSKLSTTGGSKVTAPDSASQTPASSSGSGNTIITVETPAVADVASGAVQGETLSSIVPDDKTAAETKSNMPGVQGVGTSGAAVTQKRTMVLDVAIVHTPDQTDPAATVAGAPVVALATPVLNGAESQTVSSDTSRETQSTGNLGGVGVRVARSKAKGQRKAAAKRVGNKGLADPVGIPLEPCLSPLPSIAASEGVKPRMDVGANQAALGSSINSLEHETHGPQKTDRDDGATSSACAAATSGPQGTPNEPARLESAGASPAHPKRKLRATWIKKEDAQWSETAAEWKPWSWENHADQAWRRW